MVYAISGLGDLNAGCELIPGSESVRSGQWAEMRSKYGCPERIYPFWFFPGAPTLGISVSETWFLTPVTEEGRRAQAAWRSRHPNDWYTPPYVQDTGSPDIKAGTQTNVAVKFWEGIPAIPIPCQCEQSPGFSDCKAKAMQTVAEKCNGSAECINSTFANFTVMANCAVLCKNVQCSTQSLTKQDEKLLEEIQQQAEGQRKERSRKAMMYGAVGIVAFLLWQRKKKRG